MYFYIKFKIKVANSFCLLEYILKYSLLLRNSLLLGIVTPDNFLICHVIKVYYDKFKTTACPFSVEYIVWKIKSGYYLVYKVNDIRKNI